MFTTESEWSAAYEAAETRLNLAVDQGYITYITPTHVKGIAREVARAVILSANVNDAADALNASDILDGEFNVGDNGNLN